MAWVSGHRYKKQCAIITLVNNEYVESEVPRWLEFRDESQMQYCLHVHQSGFSLNTAQPWLDKNYSGQKVIGIRSCKPALDKEGNPGSVLILKSSI